MLDNNFPHANRPLYPAVYAIARRAIERLVSAGVARPVQRLFWPSTSSTLGDQPSNACTLAMSRTFAGTSNP